MSDTTAPTGAKVIIAGAGIAGPILAIFLKLRGYAPVVYERQPALGDAGLSLCLQPNGLRILSQIPDFVSDLPGAPLTHLQAFSLLPQDASAPSLGISDGPSHLVALYGVGMRGIPRSALLRAIVRAAEAHGVPIHWGRPLVGLEDVAGAQVRALFGDGSADTADLVVGCDGLHSGTRRALFGDQPAAFTGLTQVGGFAPVPEELEGRAALVNFYGDGVHVIAYPVAENRISFAITQREGEEKETWHASDEATLEAFKTGPFSKLGCGAGKLVSNADRIVKYGLYDRPELKTWHKGRVVLLGDAAHPTSPHLGQGANQAFEDVALLSTLLDEHNADRSPPSLATLEKIFTKFERVRIPRSAELVKGAREMGERRVVSGLENCLKRNDVVREEFSNQEKFNQEKDKIFRAEAGRG
ncbi:FAD/NAD(P)-binding domain-containing protein [Dentipellis sp. KUC8613]|nr:FAD/NAD(P)-binding domain-containing protein [Dentipellis sp. KUC8613]